MRVETRKCAGPKAAISLKKVFAPAKSAGGESAAGLAHFAISAGGRENVDVLTERLRRDGYRILGEPRTTGDGYYESAVSDPEGNRVEITA